MAMRSIIIDKDRDATSDPLIVCRKSMEGSVISDENVIYTIDWLVVLGLTAL